VNALEKWAERIYSENDFGRSVATSVAGVIGLVTYLATSDWVVGLFLVIISFPIARLVADAHQGRLNNAVRQREVEETYRRLSPDEKDVVDTFVKSGGSVITWSQVNNSNICRSAIESLIQRELLTTSVTADGMRETFVLNSQLFDVGQRHATHDDRIA
jgi:hypothetical protein